MREWVPNQVKSKYATTNWIVVISLTLLQLFLTDLPQLVDLGRRTSDSPLDDIYASPQRSPRLNGICCSQSLDLDDTNPRVFWSSIMLAILQIAKPRFQGGRVVFADRLTVSDNVGFAGDACPCARIVEERNINFRVGSDIIGFTGLGIGVEKEVNTASFL